MRNPRVSWGKAVILELKFTDRFPEWFAEMVRVFNLQPSGAAKYVDGLAHHSSRAIFSTTADLDAKMRQKWRSMKSLALNSDVDARWGIERWENEGGRIRFGTEMSRRLSPPTDAGLWEESSSAPLDQVIDRVGRRLEQHTRP